MKDDLTIYYSGEKLYGDDFSLSEINEWFADEAEGYAGLGAKDKEHYSYVYHQLNYFHAFRFLKGRLFDHALGIGSAYGEEFKPIASNIQNITILDPSDAFSNVKEILGIPCDYQKPNSNGDIAFESNNFDLITSLNVMHHIPNVSHVLNESYRCLNEKGIMLLCEPISTMGDWRKPRAGLTKRERGIPLHILDRIVENAGFKIVNKSYCHFPILPKITNKLGMAAYNNVVFTIIDSFLSQIFSWNIKYYRPHFFDKLAPASVYYVLTK